MSSTRRWVFLHCKAHCCCQPAPAAMHSCWPVEKTIIPAAAHCTQTVSQSPNANFIYFFAAPLPALPCCAMLCCHSVSSRVMLLLLSVPCPVTYSPAAVLLQEREAELASLRRRAHMVTDGFNSLEDVTCNFTEGAMYSFPQVRSAALLAFKG